MSDQLSPLQAFIKGYVWGSGICGTIGLVVFTYFGFSLHAMLSLVLVVLALACITIRVWRYF